VPWRRRALPVSDRPVSGPAGKMGLLYTCCFILLRLSGSRDFAVALNAPYKNDLWLDLPPFQVVHRARTGGGGGGLSACWPVSGFALCSLRCVSAHTQGSLADLLIIVFHKLIVSGPPADQLEALLRVVLTVSHLCTLPPRIAADVCTGAGERQPVHHSFGSR
jgi:hypothetical protein